jgi:hypothetical protein
VKKVFLGSFIDFFMGSVVIEVQIISQTEFVHFTGGQQKDTGSMGV